MHVISIKFIIIKTITDEKAKFKFGFRDLVESLKYYLKFLINFSLRND